MSEEKKKSVLFVCLGNTCRSTTSEAVFRHLIKEAGQFDQWRVDSAAIMGYHVGKSPNANVMAVLADNGINGYVHRARVLTKEDGQQFDYIFGMDRWNIEDIRERIGSDAHAKVDFLGSYDPKGVLEVRDPYGSRDFHEFEHVYQHCRRCIEAFLAKHL